MAYSDKVIDHYENPRNVGSLDKNSEDVGTGLVGAPACGDVMKLQIKVEDGIITAVQKLREMSPLWEMAQEGIDIKSIKWAAH